MSPQPWPVILPLLLFVAAPACALEPWGLPDLSESDKQGHAAVGVIVGTFATAAAQRLAPRAPWWEQALVGVAASAVVGTAKEICDAQSRHHDADPKDALATVAGGIGGALTITLVWRF
jgi:hypothetical protein